VSLKYSCVADISLKLDRDEIPEMIASVPPVNSCFVLTDPEDHRCQYLMEVRHKFGTFLHDASVALRQQGEENTVDAVQMLVSYLIW